MPVSGLPKVRSCSTLLTLLRAGMVQVSLGLLPAAVKTDQGQACFQTTSEARCSSLPWAQPCCRCIAILVEHTNGMSIAERRRAHLL